MKKILLYLNPIEHLGENNYPVLSPLLTMFIITFLSEIFAYIIVKDPMVVGVYAIFLYVALIIYFSFRSGLRGGLIATFITIIYYFYIIYTRHYKGKVLSSGIETTLILGTTYLLLAGTIGWLKQKIDKLIEREADARRRMEAIVEQLPVGILITDSEGKLIQRNKKIDQILGVKIPLGFVLGKDSLNNIKIDGKFINPSESPLALSLQTGKTIIGKEYLYERQDGKHIYLTVNSSPIRKKDGKIIAAASIINDVTEKKEMEARKDDFVNMASHELKTPITSMKIYVEFLIRKIKGDERTLKTLNSIQYQTERLEDIVNNLLDVSRLQTGKLSFNREDFDLGELVTETVEGLKDAVKQQKLTFEEKKNIRVYADKFRIYQVLTNLITNAIKYSKSGTEIEVKIKKWHGNATVSVQDFGIGIVKDQQKKIFDRLYQVNDDNEKTFPGFGMGLYISQEIIRRHKGKIWVESEKGKGSTFFFSLPLV